ncbi:ABC transporter ATP-binding protein [Rhabdochromatium marinum]|uniref:ABC transporter ATP-binding protein n=1 Tax=Rhabdochromatium marinum TaxID=48729 RepID=UPI0019084596|nr:ABC transporter ATP-binding protein [Rhabdochromatium marinum]MBK1649862.1 ABC transporter ATP-binding protein [Rhabdochromatium marinum]
MSLLSVRNLGKAYRRYDAEWQRVANWFGASHSPCQEHWTLRNIDFELNPGESLGIVGRNGAGKSTLLKIITGIVAPSEGQIELRSPNPSDTQKGRIAAILELGMGFDLELTGRQNALHTAELMGFERAHVQAALPEIAAFADIGSYFDQPLRTYSTGMQARVAFAAVTAFRPDLLIVDEALSVGDAHFQAKCYERIAAFRAQGTSLILVTHAMSDVIVHCDRALLLRDGRLVGDDTPAHITNLYFDDLFGHSCPVTAAPAVDPQPEGASTHSDFDTADARERFHTRPGYRKEEHRWGEGGAVILDYRIRAAEVEYPACIESGTMTEFAFRVQFERACASVVPGLLIKTLDGVFVYGANSLVVRSGRTGGPIAVGTGARRVFRFRLPLALNGGDYLISFGISAGDQTETLIPLERRYDAVIVHVSRALPFWGLADLDATLEVDGASAA